MSGDNFENRQDWKEALSIVWKYDPANIGHRMVGGDPYIFAQYNLSDVMTPQDLERLRELGWFYDEDAGAFYPLWENKS